VSKTAASRVSARTRRAATNAVGRACSARAAHLGRARSSSRTTTTASASNLAGCGLSHAAKSAAASGALMRSATRSRSIRACASTANGQRLTKPNFR
jgi:hypothetical protein